MATMGNTGASGLIKSASGVANTIAAYNDKVKALEWDNSAQTDDDYAAYSQYLNGRIDKLNNTGTISAASQALSMLSTAKSARRSYTSNVIQRTQQDIMNGNATTTTKLNKVAELYNVALANGDENSAQNLYTQYQNLQQQIANEAESAARAAESLAKKNASAMAKGYNSQVDMLEKTAKSLINIVQEGGTGEVTSKLKEYAKNLGVELPNGEAPNIGSLIQGAMVQIRDEYSLAGQAYENVDPEKAGEYYAKADDITNDTYKVAGMNLSEANAWARDPSSRNIVYSGEGVIGTKADGTPITGPEYKTIEAPVIGYQYDASGNIQNVYSNQIGYSEQGDAFSYTNKELANDEKLKAQVKSELGQLVGEDVYIDKSGNILLNTSTDEKSQLLKDIKQKYGIDKSAPLRLVKTADGYQIKVGTQDAQKLVTLAKDAAGKFATYEQSYDVITGKANYNQIGTSDKNFNQLDNSVTQSGLGWGVNNALASAFADYGNMAQGYTESKIIPDIAKQYFSGDTAKAAAAVYAYRKPLEQQQAAKATQSMNIAPQNTLPGTQMNKVPVTSPLKAPTLGFQPAATINTDLQNAFKDYKTKPSYYTENVVIKDIAKKYYNNDEKAAATTVYDYRKKNLGV